MKQDVSRTVLSLMPQGGPSLSLLASGGALAVLANSGLCAHSSRGRTLRDECWALPGQGAAPPLWTQSSPTSVHQPMMGSGLKNTLINVSTIFCG